jgi:outer membrane murein-binding lipoprotein Lpp
MTVDLDALLAALKSDPAARDAIRREVLTEDLLALPGQVERLAAHTDALFAEVGIALAGLASRMDQLTARIDQLTARMDQLASRMDQLTEAQAQTEDTLARLIARVDVMGGEVSSLLGADYEREVLASPDGVEEAVGAAFGTVRPLTGEELTAHLSKAISEGRVTPQAARDVRRANGVFLWDQGPNDSPVYCVVEASVTAQARDVERAQRRAAQLALTGVQTVPVVLGIRAAPEIAPAIEDKQIAWQRVPPKRGERALPLF